VAGRSAHSNPLTTIFDEPKACALSFLENSGLRRDHQTQAGSLCSQNASDFRTEDMLKKTLVRFFPLTLVLTVALVTSCTNANPNPNSRATIPPGSSANPQTGMKKETGGT
jgi:hypothetical protein